MPRIEILTIGREILAGRTLDSNSHWLRGEVTSLGGFVNRVTCVDDSLWDISEEIASSRSRGTRLLITIGGLGPTSDDLTLEAVARALGRDLVVDRGALEFVRSRYEHFYRSGYVESPRLTPAREKMAAIPRGSRWLENRVGAAPGIKITGIKVTGINIEGVGMTLFSLPGVPGEMKSMFDEHVRPCLEKILGAAGYAEERVVTPVGDESLLKPILDEVGGEVPEVYIKSSPKEFGRDVRIEVLLSARSKDRESAQRLVEQAKKALLERLSSIRGA